MNNIFLLCIEKDELYRKLANTLALRDAHLDNVRILGMKQPQNVVELDMPFRLSGLILSHTVTDILTRILSGEVVSIKFIDGRNMKVQKEAKGIVLNVNLEKSFAISDVKELKQFISRISPQIIRYGSKPELGPVVYVVEKGR